jgi:hypothetical protein
MKKDAPLFDRIIHILSDLRFAVVIILSIAGISAVGTIYEAIYMDAQVAQKLVYQSVYMYVALFFLALTLIAVMIDRWPWKQHHAGFVLAHIGILILLLGAWMTQKMGIDGTMAFNIGEQRKFVTVKDTDLMVFASFDGQGMKNIYESPIDFLANPPTEKKPFIVQLGAEQMKFTDYYHFAYRDAEILPSELERDGPAIRFQLENQNVNMTEWLRRDHASPARELDLGPAKVVLAAQRPEPSGRNEVILIARPKDDKLDFVIYNKDKTLRKKGTLAQGDTVDTGWMSLKVRLLRYLPHSKEQITFTKAGYFTPVTTSAAKFNFRGQDYWIGINSVLRLYVEDTAYVVSYGFRQIELAFPLRLLDFKVGMNPGTTRAASYESQVEVPGRGEILVSMNEPLKHEGFTFYQASFERDETGKPVTSILSVNHDPGRWVKYLGSFLIVLGSVVLFYFRRVQWLKNLKGKA